MTMKLDSLQNLCLEEIVSNFCIYFEQYCSTEDSHLMLEFEFIKRKFSFHILQKLNEKECLKAEYLQFLINKYLKVLDMQWLKDWPCDTIVQKLVEIGHHLEEVTFTRFDRPWDEVLCYLPNLKSVCFVDFCTDEFLLSLSKFCKCVETLDISNSKNVSYNGLMHLCCKDNDKNIHSLHPPIKKIFVHFVNVRDEVIANALKNMPFLENIVHHKLAKILYLMHESDINAFEKVKTYNISHLNLYPVYHNNFPELTSVFTVCVSVCPHLKSLSCPILQKHHLELCSQLQELEKLELDCDAENPLELNELLTLNGRRLTSLKIYNFCMSLSILARNCPKLISLEMNRVILQYNCNDSVPVFHNLEEVVMTELVITKAVSCLLISAPNLKQLCFKSCDLRSSDIKIHILKCCEQCELNVIKFCSSDVELELVRDVLLTCSTLRTLNLFRCGWMFNDDALHELQTLSTSLPNKPKIRMLS